MEWIVEEIMIRGGGISFCDFMDLALNHPKSGYYSGRQPRFGRQGDFLTAPSASHWYGKVMAVLLARVSDRLGPLVLTDVGSGDGSFVERVVFALGGRATNVLHRAVSVEPAAAMRAHQESKLTGLSIPIEVLSDLPDEPDVAGAVILHASELYDALPVHRVVQTGDGLRELWVVFADGQLTWERRTAPPELVAYFAEHRVTLANGQMAEVNLGARAAHRRLLDIAGDVGLALILDYGYPARRLYDSRARQDGSLACYQDHSLNRDPLREPGQQDITSHVNWDDLRTVGSGAGWIEVGLWPLAEFLVRAGIQRVMDEAGIGHDADVSTDMVIERQEIKRLLDPDGMGADLKMLVQAKGEMVDLAEQLFTA